MKVSVVWTPEAERTFQAQLEYLEENWPAETLRKFIDSVFEVIDNLEENPALYPLYNAGEKYS